METVQQNSRFTLFSSKFHSNIYSILFGSDHNKSSFCNQHWLFAFKTFSGYLCIIKLICWLIKKSTILKVSAQLCSICVIYVYLRSLSWQDLILLRPWKQVISVGFFQQCNNGNKTDWIKGKKEMQYARYKGTEHPQHTLIF